MLCAFLIPYACCAGHRSLIDLITIIMYDESYKLCSFSLNSLFCYRAVPSLIGPYIFHSTCFQTSSLYVLFSVWEAMFCIFSSLHA
jgi:hypothetical protein